MTADNDVDDDIQEYVDENRDLLTRVLAHGDAEACGFALALYANSDVADNGDIERVEQVLAELETGGDI